MLTRAYSTLTIKSVDEDARLIRGIASTPETDRQDDIVVPEGAKFKLPLPLLWQHRADQPIGHVVSAKVTKAGIEIHAQIAKDLGIPRIDEAWALIKAGLVRGLSVGMQALETSRIDGTLGLKFLSWNWLELSAVTIPANASANIHTIKSLDVGLPALGTEADRRSLSPGVSGSSLPSSSPGVSGSLRVVSVTTKDTKMPKPITEQIKSFEATRQAKTARRDEIMNIAADAGVTLDEPQTQEYDTLTDEIKAVDAHLTRLAALEESNKAAAKPVVADTIAHASASRGHQVITMTKELPPGIRMARYAMCLATAQGNLMQAHEIAKARYPDDADIHLVLKTAVAAGTTTDATWAGPLMQYQNFAGDFIDFLRPATIVGKFGTEGIPSLRRVPFNVRIPTQTSGGSADWVGQGAPKPLTKFDFDTITMLWSKLAAISVLTQELVRFSTPSAEGLVRDSLAAAIIAKMDTDFVNPAKAAVANVSPASITNGITPTVATGTTAAAFRADFATMMGGFGAADLTPDTGVFIMSSKRALAVSLMLNALGQPEFPNISMRGGSLLGFPVIVSNYVETGSSPSTDLIIFVNASDIFLADDGQVVIDVSREASLQMDDAPTNNSATPTATSVVSMFQTNSIAIRAERIINWQRRRAAAVEYISNAAYSA